MIKLKYIAIATVVILVFGTIAEGYNQAHHEYLAIDACGSKENINTINKQDFECIESCKQKQQ